MRIAILVSLLSFASLYSQAQTNTFPATGNVGIGTTSPSVSLEVFKTGLNDPIARFGSTTATNSHSIWVYNGNTSFTKVFVCGSTGAFFTGTQQGDGGLHVTTEKSLFLGDGSGTPTMVLKGGNVGIGTASPTSTLYLKSSVSGGNCDLVLESANGNAQWDLVADNNNLTAGLYDVLSRKFPFGVSKGAPTYSFFIAPTGNVLIGKNTQTNAGYKLDVAGDARANRVIVNTTGADFVFDSSYDLKPLSQVENYISQNKHLPEIAPAADMQKEGIDLGENQTKLLQKIEELTLYLIEQKKLIDSLSKEVTDLKKTIKK